MRLRLTVPAVVAFALWTTLAANAASNDWVCFADKSGSQRTFVSANYSIDLANSTLDGVPARISSHVLTARKLEPDGKSVDIQINLDSGEFYEIDSAGTKLTGECEVPKEAAPEPEAGDQAQARSTPTTPNQTEAPASDNGAQAEGNGTAAATNETNAPVPDQRAAQMHQIYVDLLAKARAGKMKYLEAAKQYQHEFLRIYPEQAGNALMNEYLAYMAVVGEKVDHHKLTDTEAQYELAQKISELQEREARLQAYAATVQSAAARKADVDAATKHATEQSDARKAEDDAAARRAADEAAERTSIERQRLKLEQQVVERQQRLAEQKRRAKLLQDGLRLMFPPAVPMHTCTGSWMGTTWYQHCF